MSHNLSGDINAHWISLKWHVHSQPMSLHWQGYWFQSPQQQGSLFAFFYICLHTIDVDTKSITIRFWLLSSKHWFVTPHQRLRFYNICDFFKVLNWLKAMSSLLRIASKVSVFYLTEEVLTALRLKHPHSSLNLSRCQLPVQVNKWGIISSIQSFSAYNSRSREYHRSIHIKDLISIQSAESDHGTHQQNYSAIWTITPASSFSQSICF